MIFTQIPNMVLRVPSRDEGVEEAGGQSHAPGLPWSTQKIHVFFPHPPLPPSPAQPGESEILG